MRPFRLARIAAEAEGIRLRGMMTRIITRIIYAAAALCFVLGALAFGHIAAWYEIRTVLNQTYLATTGILGGVDLLLAIILLLLASGSSRGRTEIEAREVRRQAFDGLAGALSVTQLVLTLLSLISEARRRRRA
jgi:hypothetical protein